MTREPHGHPDSVTIEKHRSLAVVLVLLGVSALALWLADDGTADFVRREPGMDDRPAPALTAAQAEVLARYQRGREVGR